MKNAIACFLALLGLVLAGLSFMMLTRPGGWDFPLAMAAILCWCVAIMLAAPEPDLSRLDHRNRPGGRQLGR